jgi:serine O-acetyltransferase
MLRRIERLFGPEATQRGDSLLALIISDYVAFYGPKTRMRTRWGIFPRTSDSPRRLALRFIPRLIVNPSLHATVMIRLATRGPRFMLWGFWRRVLISKHSIEIGPDLEIGPGLVLPHPVGIGLGGRVRLGRNVTILHYVGIGTTFFTAQAYLPGGTRDLNVPALGDDVIVLMNSTLVGGIDVGARSVIAAGAWVDRDLPPKTIYPGRAALNRRLEALESPTASRDGESGAREALDAD